MVLLPGGTCKGKPCWKRIGRAVNPRGLKFKNGDAAPDGVSKAKFKAGGHGEARVQIIGKGEKLDLPSLSLEAPVTVQLLVDDGTTVECWHVEYGTTQKNQKGKFKARVRARRKTGESSTSGGTSSD